MYKKILYFCSIFALLSCLGLIGCGKKQVLLVTAEDAVLSEDAETPLEESVSQDEAESAVEEPEADGATTAGIEQGLININTAGKEQLMQLNGIGNVRAEAIIAYRETYGAFKTPRDITKVYGIGEGIFKRIEQYITVK